MAKKSKEKKKYVEFKYSGDTFEYSGRIYPDEDSKRLFMYLTLDDVLTISCHLVNYKKDKYFISFPDYKQKDGNYKSFIYTDEGLNEELDSLVNAIVEALESE